MVLVVHIKTENLWMFGIIWLTTTFFRSDDDPQELWVVAMFKDAESYRANAESAAQHAIYLTLRACLEEDPEWHDVDEMISIRNTRASG